MKIRLEFSPEVDVRVVTDKEGGVAAIEFVPLFPSSKATAVVAYGLCTSDRKQTLDRFILTVSGVTGSVIKRSRTGAAALIDQDPAAADTADPGEDDEPTDEERL